MTTKLLLSLAAIAALGTAGAQAQDLERERLEPPVSQEEALERAAERFEQADRDGDGKITAEEIGKNRESRRAGRAQKMIERLDTDGDGAISEAEMREHARQRFAKVDTDGNGVISEEEAEAAKKAMRSRYRGGRRG